MFRFPLYNRANYLHVTKKPSGPTASTAIGLQLLEYQNIPRVNYWTALYWDFQFEFGGRQTLVLNVGNFQEKPIGLQPFYINSKGWAQFL